MSYLQRQMNVLKFDKRLLEYNLKNGVISKQEYDQHINSLKDSQGNSGVVDLKIDPRSKSLNGNHHPSQETSRAPQPTPLNRDPFGSGF